MIRTPRICDLPYLTAFYEQNQQHLAPWETVTDPLLLESTCEASLNSWEKELIEGTGIRFFLFSKTVSERALIGSCNFSQIVYGPFQACYLGYKIDIRYQGKGVMQEALQAAISYVFEEKGLHRIMANYMPHNHRSARLLRRLGFQIEGYAKEYLLINGQWEDHILTSKHNSGNDQ